MIGNDWDKVLKELYETKRFKNLLKTLEEEYLTNEVYPLKKDLFRALKLTTFSDVKVVILGQDPYHTEGVADGLAFSTKNNSLPPSLRNIYKELKNDLSIVNQKGDLTSWAKEGVLLLNTHLTVLKNKPLSHRHLDWEYFTDYVINVLNKEKHNIVFILWGNHAISKNEIITNKNHLVLTSSHPSPFSANKSFFGSKVFSKTNDYLIKHNLKQVDFTII